MRDLITETARFRHAIAYGYFPYGWQFSNGRRFENTAWVVYRPITETVQAGSVLEIETNWIALGDAIQDPRRIFVHIIDPSSGKIIAQHDGLDAPAKFWQRNDTVEQIHKLSIPSDTRAGKYEVRIGLYNPVTGKRVLEANYAHSEPPKDYYLLGTIEVTR
jgi:hypothetical protein